MPRSLLHAVFCLSGFAALLYQVVWQRSLFALLGINLESVTVIVTAFMLGLGVGSLIGGAVSRDPTRPVLLLFSLVEAGIGLFGLVSMGLIHAVGDAVLGAPGGVIALVTFLLVLVPTLLMGATLPLLVAYVVRASGNVGRSVGSLYFVNPLGSAMASFASVLLLLPHLGQRGTVWVAAGLNLAVAALVLVLHRRAARLVVDQAPLAAEGRP